MDKDTDTLNTLVDSETALIDNDAVSDSKTNDGSDLDIESNEVMLVAIENRINDLLYLATDVISVSGMNQTFALEAEKLIPEFANTPIGYFSKDLSATRYRVSLESFLSNIKKAIISICEFISKMVQKFIDWLFPPKEELNFSISLSSETLSSLEKSIGEAVKLDDKWVSEMSRQITEYGNKQIDDLVKSSIADIHSKSKRVSTETIALENDHIPNIDSIIKNYISDEGDDSELAFLLNEYDPLFHDVMNNGEYYSAVKKVKDCAKYINTYMKRVEKDIDILDKCAKDPINKIGDLVKIEKFVISESIIPGISEITFSDVAKHITDARNKVKDDHRVRPTITFSKLNSVFSNAVKSLRISETLIYVERSESYLKSLHLALDQFKKNLSSLKDNEDTVEAFDAIRKALHIVQFDLLGCLKYIREIGTYATLLKNMYTKFTSANVHVVKLVKAEMIKMYGSIPSEVSDSFKEMEQTFKKAA